jgi:hypothetical protein
MTIFGHGLERFRKSCGTNKMTIGGHIGLGGWRVMTVTKIGQVMEHSLSFRSCMVEERVLLGWSTGLGNLTRL